MLVKSNKNIIYGTDPLNETRKMIKLRMETSIDEAGITRLSFSNRLTVVYIIPRILLKEAEPYLKEQMGIYFKIGQEDDESHIYTGRATNLYKRLRSKNYQGNQYWHTVIVVTTLDNSLREHHIKVLEYWSDLVIQETFPKLPENKRYKPLNEYRPEVAPSHFNEKKELLDHFRCIRSLLFHRNLFFLGSYNIIERKFYLSSKNIKAVGEFVNGQSAFRVSAGSMVAVEIADSVKDKITKLRQALLLLGVLEDKGDFLLFKKDYEFPSVSLAASFILGYSSDGWSVWKDELGHTLSDVYRDFKY